MKDGYIQFKVEELSQKFEQLQYQINLLEVSLKQCDISLKQCEERIKKSVTIPEDFYKELSSVIVKYSNAIKSVRIREEMK